jgi:hypothetical protein
MSDPFSRALDAIYRGSWAKAATYTPPAGVAVSVTVVVGKPEQLSDGGFMPAGFQLGAEAQADALVARVRRSEIPLPVKAATLAIDGLTYPVRHVGELDVEGLEWPLVLGKPS